MQRSPWIAITTRCAVQLSACAHYAPRTVALALAVHLVLNLRHVAPLFDAYDVSVLGAEPAARSSAAAFGFEDLADAHLFGEALVAREPAPLRASAAETPPTSLDLTLTGTLLADDADASQAIIGEAGTERRYRAGEILASGGARLYAIHVDHVILERDGNLEALRPRPWSAAGSASATPLVAAAPPPDAAPLEAAQIAARVASSDAAEGTAAPPKLLAPGETPVGNVIRFTAYRDGGVVGLRAGPGRDSQTFRDLGLRAGDVITSVNGTSLGAPPNGAALVQALQTSSLVRVSIVRGGVPQVVTIPAAAFGDRLARR